MELLEIVQSLHQEAKLPGSPPTAVTGQIGRAADLVRWAIEAWNDIQRDRDGKWKWLRAEFTLDTVADTPNYTSGDATDVATAAAITRFRAWDIDSEDQPFIYLVSEGKSEEANITWADWRLFRRLYVRGTHTAARPSAVSVDSFDKLWFGPTPNGVYRLSSTYWRSNQILVADDDVPEMPADYHMLIVYRALLKYAYGIVGREILARARADGTPLLEALVKNQWYGRFRFDIADALA